MTQSAIEAALAQATQAANNFVPMDVAQAGGNTAPAAYNQPAAGPLSVDDMLSGNLDVKAWLKVNKFGLFIGADTKPFETMKVRVNFDEVQWCYAVKFGNPAKYEKTYDHVTDVKGRPWPQVLQMAQSIDPNASEFRSADVPFVLREQLVNKNGEVMVDVDESVGNSIATTGFKYFQKFVREAQRMGINIYSGAVDFDLGFKPEKNDKGEWGVLTFTNLVAA